MSNSSFHEETEIMAMGESAKREKPELIDGGEDGNKLSSKDVTSDPKPVDLVKTNDDAVAKDEQAITDELNDEKEPNNKQNKESGENEDSSLVSVEPEVLTVTATDKVVEEEYEPTLAELAGIHLDGKDSKQLSQDECLRNWMARRLREES